MIRVTLADARAIGYCSRGCREFARLHGLDWQRFVREGLPLEEVEALDDAMMGKAIEAAKKREAVRGQE